MKTNNITLVGFMIFAMSLTSCGSFASISGGEYGYENSYPSDVYNVGIGYDVARRQALFLADKMAYELRLNAAQYDAVYEINLDYLLNIRSNNDLYGRYWARRNSDLRYVLSVYQYKTYIGANYFYRPVYWYNNRFAYTIYNRYNDRGLYYYRHPSVFSSYKGGNNRHNNSYYANKNFSGRNHSMPVTRSNGTVKRPNRVTNNRENGNAANRWFGNSGNNKKHNNNVVNSKVNPNRNGKTPADKTFGGKFTEKKRASQSQNSKSATRNNNNASGGHR